MSKVLHFVHKDSRDGSRSIVSFEEGEEQPFASRLVSQEDWFNVVAPAMRKTCLVAVVNHAQNVSRWEDRGL
jgi:hypothetical protein